MATKKIALAYCIDNLPIAEALHKALAQTSYSVGHYFCKKSTEESALADQLRDFDGTILLLISDNFLRSEHCMNRALQLVQQKSGNILPVVVDGRTRDEVSGHWINTPTKFERIGDIIPYINYWQNKYLDLRSQKRKFEAESEADKRDELNEHLRILRQVSSEASEFLRVLRNMQYYQFDDFVENHLRAFFDFVEDSAEWAALQAREPQMVVKVEEAGSLSGISVDNELVLADKNSTEEQPNTETIAPIGENNNPADSVDQTNVLPSDGSEIIQENVDAQELTGAELAENLEDLGVVIAEHITALEQEQPLEIPPLEPLTEVHPEAQNEVLADIQGGENDTLDIASDLAPAQVEPGEDVEEEDEPNTSERVSELIRQARGMVASGQIEEGVTYLKQAIKLYPGSAELHYFYGLVLAQNTRDLSGSLEQLTLATEIDPEHEAAFFLLGELAEHQGDFNAARKYYERLIEINENFPDVHYRLGTVLQAFFVEEVGYAAKCFKKAAKQNPGNADAHYQYASLLNEVMGDAAGAESYFLQTLAIQAKHPFANYDLALIYHAAGDATKALQYYEAAIINNPELKTPENEIVFRGSIPEPEQKEGAVSETVGEETIPFELIEEPVLSAEVSVEEPEILESTLEANTVIDAATPIIAPLLSIEHDTIEALKQNILRLEELLKAKAAQAEEEQATLAAEVEEPLEVLPPKTVLITGATSGIGLAIAHTFAQAGWRLILTGRRAERLEEIKTALIEAGTEVLSLVFDVRDYNAVSNTIAHLPEAWRKIDLLINNAGKAKGLSEIQDGSLEHWEEMIDTNIKGLLYLTRCVSPLMVEQHSGHIINIGSIAGKEPYPMGNVYCASKAAVDMLTRAMRMDLYKYNIRVSQIAPGHVEETEFALVRFDGDSERAKIYGDFQPLTANDVANTVFFMATQPSHVNIQDVVIYGTQQASATLIDRSGRP